MLSIFILIFVFFAGCLAAGIGVWVWLNERLLQSRLQSMALTNQLEQERKHYEEKLRLLAEARESLGKEFENLAHRIFDDKQEKFHQQSRERLDNVISPLREQLSNFH